MSIHFVDSHAHLDFEQFDQDLEETILRANSVGVSHILQIALGPSKERLSKGYEIVQKHPNMRMAVGLHPHEADHWNQEILHEINFYADKPEVVAIGEIGLDYYYEHSNRDNQKKAFSQLIDLAIHKHMPICVHTRDAFDDTLAIIQEKKVFKTVGGVIHCFTGNKEQATAFLDEGAFISFSGVVTFKNATDLHEAVRQVPLERMLVETDCPYLAPVPHRGKRNEPAYVLETAKTIAALKGCSLTDLAQITTHNARSLFKF